MQSEITLRMKRQTTVAYNENKNKFVTNNWQQKENKSSES